MELQFDPFADADAAHLFDVTWPGTERQAVQHVNDLLVGRKLLVERTGRNKRRNNCECQAFHGCETSTETKFQTVYSADRLQTQNGRS